MLENRFELGAKFRLNTHLGDDGCFHGWQCIAFALHTSILHHQ